MALRYSLNTNLTEVNTVKRFRLRALMNLFSFHKIQSTLTNQSVYSSDRFLNFELIVS